MVNVTQYPDILQFTKVSGGSSYYDDQGNLVIVEPTETQVEYRCRAEANLKGAYIINTDGSQLIFSWRVFFPLKQNGSMIEEIPVNTVVNVFRKEALRASGTIKRFIVDQKNAKAEI